MNKHNKLNRKNGVSAINNGAVFAAKPFEKFKGQLCLTAFADKAKNPDNKKKGPRKGHKCEAPPKMTDKAHI